MDIQGLKCISVCHFYQLDRIACLEGQEDLSELSASSADIPQLSRRRRVSLSTEVDELLRHLQNDESGSEWNAIHAGFSATVSLVQLSRCATIK